MMNRGKGCDFMKRDKKTYIQLFLSTFRLSACTFGGGFVIIPLMRKRVVEELHWIDEQEMLNFTAIAQSSPGPIAVNASILVGYQVAGALGALLTVLGTVLPPLVIISVVSLFYQAFRDSALANMALSGMLCGVAAVVLDVVINMALGVIRQKRILPLAIMAASFVALRYFSVNILVIILLCALIGAGDTWVRGRREARA